jgi:putative membrane protein
MSKFSLLVLAAVVESLLALTLGGVIPTLAASETTINDAFLIGTVPAPVTDEDRTFMMEAASGGMAEVEMGRLAATKGMSAAVKGFGQRMVRDHSKANAELKQLAMRKGVTLPSGPTPEQTAAKERLSSLSGAEFDREYMSMMVEDHDKDVKAFEDKSANAADPDLKRFVVKTLPTLKVHQSMAHKIKDKQ